MREASAFEALLARSVAAHARRVDRPFDPRELADAAVLGHRTPAEQAFGFLSIRARLALVGLAALLAIGLAVAGARLLEPRPIGWGATLYFLADQGPAGGTTGGPFLLSVPVGTDDAPTLRVELDAAGRGLPAGLQLESISPSGRFALLTTHQRWPVEEPGTRVVVDLASAAVTVLPVTFGAVWAPAGDRLAWWTDPLTDGSISVTDAASGQSRQVFTAHGGVGGILWVDEAELVVSEWYRVPCDQLLLGCTPNGDGAFERAESTTWRVAVDSGAATIVDRPGSIPGWRGGPYDPNVPQSPDRSLVAYFVEDLAQLEPPAFPRSTTITVWVHEPDGANARALATFTRSVDGPFAPLELDQTVWSVDSQTFSWAALGSLWVARADATALARYDLPEGLLDAASGRPHAFTWQLP